MHNKQEDLVGLGDLPHKNRSQSSARGDLFFAFAVALLVFASALLGILTRPLGFLAAFWPANAVLMGLMICNPHRHSLFVWVGAFIAYVGADLLTGGLPLITFWMTVANMSGAAVGYCLYRRLPDQDRLLGRPLSVLVMFCVCVISALVAALVGAVSARILFDQDVVAGFEFWFSGELVNYLSILPVILTFPRSKPESAKLAEQHDPQKGLVWRPAPMVALIISLIMGSAFGGPGAISFAVPALLWCAISYSVFFSTLCTLTFCAWMLITTSSGAADILIADQALRYASSAKMGVALISIAPLAAAAMNASRLSLVARLLQAAHYDFLTGSLARGEFMKRGRDVLKRSTHDDVPVAVLMLDIDWFKRINDMHGHAIGDKALAAFAEAAKSALRAEDVFGRIGGEEFGLVIPGQDSTQAFATADRIRRVVAEHCAALVGQIDKITVSIGVASTDRHPGEDLEGLLRMADQALYKAKSDGRNRVVQS